jgi:hypothetical protein
VSDWVALQRERLQTTQKENQQPSDKYKRQGKTKARQDKTRQDSTTQHKRFREHIFSFLFHQIAFSSFVLPCLGFVAPGVLSLPFLLILPFALETQFGSNAVCVLMRQKLVTIRSRQSPEPPSPVHSNHNPKTKPNPNPNPNPNSNPYPSPNPNPNPKPNSTSSPHLEP